MRKLAKISFGIISIFTILLCVITGFYYIKLPDKFYLSDKGNFKINTNIYISTDMTSEFVPASSSISGGSDGAYVDAELKLFGVIPIKEVRVEKIDRPVLVPCGIPFGIKILTEGAIVTGFGEVGEEDISPAKTGGIKCGDIITEVNGIKISKNKDITDAVQLKPDGAVVKIKRDEETIVLSVKPVLSGNDKLFKIGVWVRDSSAGIGTLTYYDAEKSVFGGLGHSVCDVDTGRMLPLFKGEAVSVAINDVIKGVSGNPGELCGTFLSRVPIGIIECNTEVGVFGTMNYAPTLDAALPMAYKQEVQIGPATILSTLSGSTPKEYDILIEKIDYNDSNQIKNMIIKVTDRELLSEAGGIVQGMSGSPIIQNNKLVGAVTHVFVNDTTRGYAIFAENMYRKSAEVLQDIILDDVA